MVSREISFIGNLVGTYTDLQELMTLTAQGQVSLHTTTYPLAAVNDAMADLDGGRPQGRGILIPAGSGPQPEASRQPDGPRMPRVRPRRPHRSAKPSSGSRFGMLPSEAGLANERGKLQLVGPD
jgi:hypothetical protein